MKNNIPTFEVNESCSTCGGRCCKNMACHFSPDDFDKISFDALKTEIDKGCISIDWWEERDGSASYYLRMRHVDGPIVDPSWGGRCILLTKTGCPLPFEKRPLGARALKPKEPIPRGVYGISGGICHSYYSKEQCKNDWKKYEDILIKLLHYANHQSRERLNQELNKEE